MLKKIEKKFDKINLDICEITRTKIKNQLLLDKEQILLHNRVKQNQK